MELIPNLYRTCISDWVLGGIDRMQWLVVVIWEDHCSTSLGLVACVTVPCESDGESWRWIFRTNVNRFHENKEIGRFTASMHSITGVPAAYLSSMGVNCGNLRLCGMLHSNFMQTLPLITYFHDF